MDVWGDKVDQVGNCSRRLGGDFRQAFDHANQEEASRLAEAFHGGPDT